MKKYDYVIIGGGMSTDAAVGGIREIDSRGSIGIISSEPDRPYNRPPLTKALWKGEPIESIWRKTPTQDLEFHLARRVVSIDLRTKSVTDHQGEIYAYKKLLLATGGSPRRLPFGEEHILYYRTLADYRRLRALADKKERFAVIGGGFIGSEIAAALAMNHKAVTMVFPGNAVCSRMFPPELADFLNQFYREKGVQVWSGESVAGLVRRGEQLVLNTASGRALSVDGVVAGLGISPNSDLAETAGLQMADGIIVDEFLRTSAPDVFAAGDVAAFYNPALQKRLRVEHEDNANTMGRLAGRNMAGAVEPYHHLPFFYSDLFELGYEAVGELDARLDLKTDWKEPCREGVIYYQKDSQVRGVLLWNVWGKVESARALIAKRGPLAPEAVRLPQAG